MPHKFVDQKPKNTRFAVKSFIKSLGKFRFTIVLSLTFALIANILNLFSPKIIGNMTNSAVESVSTTGTLDFAPIKQSLIFLIVIIAVVAILSYFESFLLARTTAHYTRSLRSQIIQKIARLPISYFDKHQFGDTLSILSNDVDALWNALTEGLTQIITSLTTIIGCLVMMIIISPLLALVAVVVVPLAIFTLSKIIKRAQSHFVSQRKVLGQLNARIEEDYSGQLIIKSNSHESASFAEFQLANQKLYEDSWKAQFLGSLAFPFVHFFTNLGYVAVCVLGGQMVLNGTLLIGGVQAFIQYLSRFNHPLSTLSEIVATIEQTLAAAERVFTFLNEPEESPDPEPSRKVKKVQGAVEFHDVSFSYDKKRPVINHFSVKVNPGEQVAIVGPTGAGKTTIINLLMRFYDPDSGYITIDGVPTREMKRSDVRALFGMVLQDTWLFSGSIKDNLKYGNSSATLKELKKATSAANIDHLIESMKGGYNAEINEDSDNISAGEKQLLTIARAMVENPPMMILDEATSNVDTRAEALIQEAFNKLTHGRTSFVIAHRLSTIRNANLILVMKDGAIVEQGTHAELLKQNGFYAELYNSQFAPKNNA
ncbi:ABC transporter ATP-binding protein [Candidatus Saccharibacteria bacterium]|nr:ABC transporter ATP-binding protein [Candidatus Saccharibacteria bacterium]